MPKPPSPCIDVCKFKLRGHCIGCGMTKAQKKMTESMGGEGRRAFIAALLVQQQKLGRGFAGWPTAYRRKCEKKGKPCPLDEQKLTAAE